MVKETRVACFSVKVVASNPTPAAFALNKVASVWRQLEVPTGLSAAILTKLSEQGPAGLNRINARKRPPSPAS